MPAGTGLLEASDHWLYAKDGDSHCLGIYRRHYSARRYLTERQPLFVGPGKKLVLLSKSGRSLFVWRQFINDCQPAQTGINCAVFRNEGEPSGIQSSYLIKEAVEIVWSDWGRHRLYTLVNAAKIASTNPGYCFIAAGWSKAGTSKKGKAILELLP
jgi:uncharacterized protein YbdZ (MbtH family)